MIKMTLQVKVIRQGLTFPLWIAKRSLSSPMYLTLSRVKPTLRDTNTWGDNRDSNTITSPTHQSDQGINKIKDDRSNPKISLGICVEGCSKDREMFEETIKKFMKRQDNLN